MVEVFKLFLAKLYVCVEFGRIGKVAHPGLMRKHRHHAIVGFDDPRGTVDMNLAKLYFVDDVLV